jgi:hypothetical protein
MADGRCLMGNRSICQFHHQSPISHHQWLWLVSSRPPVAARAAVVVAMAAVAGAVDRTVGDRARVAR